MHKNQIHLGQTKRVKEKSRNGILPLWPNGLLTFSTAHAAAAPDIVHARVGPPKNCVYVGDARDARDPKVGGGRKEKKKGKGIIHYPHGEILP